MDYAKMLKMVMATFEKSSARKIKRLREDIEAEREAMRMIQAVVKEITKPPKPLKIPKTYRGLDGKRHRLATMPVANVRTA